MMNNAYILLEEEASIINFYRNAKKRDKNEINKPEPDSGM